MSTDYDLIELLIASLVHSWNAGDCVAFGSLFCADADYAPSQGDTVHGRGDIALLAAAGPAHVVRTTGAPRIGITGASATASFRWILESSGKPRREGEIQLSIVANGKRQWRIRNLKNTDAPHAVD